jgi:hypothetical protein
VLFLNQEALLAASNDNRNHKLCFQNQMEIFVNNKENIYLRNSGKRFLSGDHQRYPTLKVMKISKFGEAFLFKKALGNYRLYYLL